MDGKYSCLFQNLSRASSPVDSGYAISPHTSSAEIPAASISSAMEGRPPRMSSDSGRWSGMSPNISALASSMWSIPVASSMTGSRAWENGGWHMSWSSPAMRTAFESSSSREMASAILPARWYVPRQCSKRVWFAAGNTRLPRPSCLTDLSLCISWRSMTSRKTPSTSMLPWTGSWTTLDLGMAHSPVFQSLSPT